jgi:hypothetical protein
MATVITSITGLQNLTNLENFNADYNALTTVNLSGLANLLFVDISDNEKVDFSENSLTSVNLSGCTSLQTLRLDDSNFAAGIPNLSGLTDLSLLDMDQCSITGNVDLSMLPALEEFDLSGNTGLTSVTISDQQPLIYVNLYDTDITEVSVNDILETLDNNGIENGSVNLGSGTSAAPTGAGATAATNLQAKGWGVTVNEPTTTTTTSSSTSTTTSTSTSTTTSTSTSTSTTTTTTTVAPTTTTTTTIGGPYYYNVDALNYGTGCSLIGNTNVVSDIPAIIGKYYDSPGISPTGAILVLSVAGSGSIDATSYFSNVPRDTCAPGNYLVDAFQLTAGVCALTPIVSNYAITTPSSVVVGKWYTDPAGPGGGVAVHILNTNGTVGTTIASLINERDTCNL